MFRKQDDSTAEVLGLQPRLWFNEPWIEFDLGNTTFAIDRTGEELSITPGTSTGAAFEVDDIRAMRQRLIDSGAHVTEVMSFHRAGRVLRAILKVTASHFISGRTAPANPRPVQNRCWETRCYRTPAHECVRSKHR